MPNEPAEELRAHGIPARSRCGFGTYFAPGHYVDHWVGEYWDAARGRWVMADAQLDEVQRALFKTDFDVLDVPRDRFLVAGDAWNLCRTGKADPSKFGILDMNGLWFIGGNLIRDVAALNRVEMLPWDAWGAMPQPGEEMDRERLAFFDHLAAPDTNFTALRHLYATDDRVRVPATVFNVITGNVEPVHGPAATTQSVPRP